MAAGKLILAIQKERDEAQAPDAARAGQVIDRAHVLLQASQSSLVSNLLDGRTVVEYLDMQWVEEHPAVKPSIESLVAALKEHEKP